MDDLNDGDEPPFDEDLAATYVGKYILIGLTYLDHAGDVVRQEQLHGVIVTVSRRGVEISLRGTRDGELWNMPPELSAIYPADPGTYTLHTTNEAVENPDLIATWEINAPPPKGVS